MIELTIVVEEYNNDQNEYTGRQVTKKVWWSCVPRIGEELTIQDNGFSITNVDHWIDGDGKSYPQIRVSTKCDIVDFKFFANEESWTKEFF